MKTWNTANPLYDDGYIVDDRVARESRTGPEKKSLTEVRLDDELFAGSKGPNKLLASSLAPLPGAFPPSLSNTVPTVPVHSCTQDKCLRAPESI